MMTDAPSSGNEAFVMSLIEDARQVQGGHLYIGKNGYVLCCGKGRTLSGYDTDRMKALCLNAKLLIIDARTVPYEKLVHLVIGGPMIAVGEPPRHVMCEALSTRSLVDMAQRYRAIGADIHNVPEG